MPKPVDIHPIANIFPMMNADELAGLVADIKQNGLREELIFWKDQLIDGRNRIKACEIAGVDWAGHALELDEDTDPVAYVISHNLHRRHLDPGQKSLIGARLRRFFDEQAKERMSEGGKSAGNGREKKGVENLPPPTKARDAAGASVGVSGKLIDAATTVLKHGSKDLIAKVESGEVAVSKAAKIAKTVAKPQQVKAATEPAPKHDADSGCFDALRRLFDKMTVAQRIASVEMWSQWMESTT